jgi:hypothetical protein
MNDAPVVPEVNKEPKPAESKPKSPLKKPAARKKASKKPLTKKSVKKAQRRVGRLSAQKVAKAASAKKTAAKRQRKPFPYARVLKMWKAGKSSMEIAKAVGRYDSKAADPMHSFRVTLTRFHRGVRINGKLVKLPHRVSKKALKLATKAGRKAIA